MKIQTALFALTLPLPLSLLACATEHVQVAAPTKAPTPVVEGPFQALGADASPITFERMARYPEPGWQVPRSFSWSHDKSAVLFLMGKENSDVLALHRVDLATGEDRVLLTGESLSASTAPTSREEELRRERQRQRAKGITSYAKAGDNDALLVPFAGDLFLSKDGTVTRLTETKEPEIDPKICDDGSLVTFVRGDGLYALDVATKKETRLAQAPAEGTSVGLSDFNAQEELDETSGQFLSPDCQRVAYIEVDERGVTPYPVLGFRDGKPDLMMQRYPFASGENPLTRVGIVDIKTRKTTWLSLAGASGSTPQNALYFARFSFSSDGRWLNFVSLSRDQKVAQLWQADTQTGKASSLAKRESKAWVELGEMKSFEGRDALWLAERDGHQHIDLVSGTTAMSVPVTEGPWDVEHLVKVDVKNRRAFFTATKDGPLDRHLYSVAISGEKAIKRLTHDAGIHQVNIDPQSDRFVDLSSAIDRAPEVVVRDSDGQKVRQLPTVRDADLDALALRAPERVELKASSGETLYAFYLPPKQAKPGEKHPAIVMVYGGPGVQTAQNRFQARLLWQHLSDRGFGVFQLDNRGSSGRGQTFATAVYGRLGDVELEDQLVGREWLAGRPEIDRERIGIYGHSYGGFMVAKAMLAAPGRFRAGVSASPVTDWAGYDAGYTDRYMGLLPAAAASFEATALPKLAGNLTGKLFLIHALMDENVHFDHTANLIDALVKQNRDFDSLVLPGERHGYRDPVVRAYVYRRVADFFAENL